ncbi:MAG: hypothetical protein K2P78_01555 [Gemmataceae bacterium]|nr:hypothetical protein [Gemmataceae bacterium]
MPTKPEEWFFAAASLVVFAVLFGLFALVVRDTVRRRGWWGVNVKGLAGAECPRCGEPLPAVRKPKNRRQVLWGGWTCDECGCEIDKWGREVPGSPAEDDR